MDRLKLVKWLDDVGPYDECTTPTTYDDTPPFPVEHDVDSSTTTQPKSLGEEESAEGNKPIEQKEDPEEDPEKELEGGPEEDPKEDPKEEPEEEEFKQEGTAREPTSKLSAPLLEPR